jgi:hypothetical protein
VSWARKNYAQTTNSKTPTLTTVSRK